MKKLILILILISMVSIGIRAAAPYFTDAELAPFIGLKLNNDNFDIKVNEADAVMQSVLKKHASRYASSSTKGLIYNIKTILQNFEDSKLSDSSPRACEASRMICALYIYSQTMNELDQLQQPTYKQLFINTAVLLTKVSDCLALRSSLSLGSVELSRSVEIPVSANILDYAKNNYNILKGESINPLFTTLEEAEKLLLSEMARISEKIMEYKGKFTSESANRIFQTNQDNMTGIDNDLRNWNNSLAEFCEASGDKKDLYRIAGDKLIDRIAREARVY